MHKTLAAAITKAGAAISAGEGKRHHYIAKKGSNTVEWYTQDGFDRKTQEFTPDKPCVTICFTDSPHSDPYTDYCADRFYHTIKEAVAALG
jgi:hypothetical protein